MCGGGFVVWFFEGGVVIWEGDVLSYVCWCFYFVGVGWFGDVDVENVVGDVLLDVGVEVVGGEGVWVGVYGEYYWCGGGVVGWDGGVEGGGLVLEVVVVVVGVVGCYLVCFWGEFVVRMEGDVEGVVGWFCVVVGEGVSWWLWGGENVWRGVYFVNCGLMVIDLWFVDGYIIKIIEFVMLDLKLMVEYWY